MYAAAIVRISIFFLTAIWLTLYSSLAASGTRPLEPYFPAGTFSDLTYDAFLVRTFETHLKSLSENPIWPADGYRFRIRCLWMSSYKGDELIRIDEPNTGNAHTVHKRKKLDVQGRALVVRITSDKVPNAILSNFLAGIENDRIWDLSNEQDVISSDGPIWMMEVVYHGVYHAAYRTDPNAGAFRRACMNSAKVAHVAIEIQ